MKKLSLVAVLATVLVLVGCWSTSETEIPTQSETPQVVENVDVCTKYVELIECVLKSQSNSETGDDQQAYMNIIKDTITSYPADQQPTYCREQWDAILQYADTYASYWCPME